jgi:hypothetical protein
MSTVLTCNWCGWAGAVRMPDAHGNARMAAHSDAVLLSTTRGKVRFILDCARLPEISELHL